MIQEPIVVYAAINSNTAIAGTGGHGIDNPYSKAAGGTTYYNADGKPLGGGGGNGVMGTPCPVCHSAHYKISGDGTLVCFGCGNKIKEQSVN